MAIARAHLTDELTVHRLIEDLIAAWDDAEADVLVLLGRLFEADMMEQRSNRGITFYYNYRLEAENADNRVRYQPHNVRLAVRTDSVVHILRTTAQLNDWHIEDKRLRVIVNENNLENLSSAQLQWSCFGLVES